MARSYAAVVTRAVHATQLTVGAVFGTSAVRPTIYEITFGSSATPADNAILWHANRTTTAGSGGSSVTPQAIDSGDPASTSTCTQAQTTDPTFATGSNILSLPINQRSTQRWVAQPGREIKCAASATNGFAIRAIHASFTGDVYNTIMFDE